MNSARYVGIGLFAIATHAHAGEWADNDISDILDKVKAIYNNVNNNVTVDVKNAAQDLIQQRQRRPQQLIDNVGELLEWYENRRTPLQDFVNGGAGRCGQGSPCAKFRTDLRTFALQMAELKDRFPTLAEHGLGDSTFFADIVNILPPFALFGIHEILRRIPDWQDLPLDLADIFDEIGDSEVFSTTLEPSLQVAAASAELRTTAAASNPSLTRAKFPMERFCSKGKEAHIDNVRFNRLKGFVTRWKNRFDSFSEYPADEATISLIGEGAGNLKVPTKAFLKTVSNALDSLHDLMETHRANLELCAKVEADIAACAPLVEYRTEAGARKAYFVMSGILNRSSLALFDKTDANGYLTQARARYNAATWKDTYFSVCDAYQTLVPRRP